MNLIGALQASLELALDLPPAEFRVYDRFFLHIPISRFGIDGDHPSANIGVIWLSAGEPRSRLTEGAQ